MCDLWLSIFIMNCKLLLLLLEKNLQKTTKPTITEYAYAKKINKWKLA